MNNAQVNRPGVALVTGGSRGIGRAVVGALARADWRVYYCSRSRDSLARAQQELQGLYPDRVSGWLCDVTDESAIEELVGRVANQEGRLDCLVNNAGIGLFAPLEEISASDWRRVIDTNLNSAFFSIRAAAPIMKRQGAGWIFNIASLAGRNPFPRGSVYNASKAGLVALSEAAMLELRSYGIRVTAVLPGSVDTEFSHPQPGVDNSWKLAPADVARVVLDHLAYPERALPSLVELRPSRPPKK
jgi:NAD(P)-dependent dehydrogenase (short-subunit alcohol dehydrogenase family)